MQVRPVRKYASPRFPTNEIIERHPEFLRIVPRRWRSNPLVLTALAGACVLLTSCRTEAKPQGSISKVAPIFEHGKGSGSFGCKAVNPPVFLSEEEARQVITEEGKRAGITFAPDNRTLKRVSVPATDRYGFLSDGTKTEQKTLTADLALDGTDGRKDISFEFVSREDFISWEKRSGKMATVYTIDVRSAADALRDGLVKRKPGGTYAVFYDPAGTAERRNYTAEERQNIDWTAERKRMEEEAWDKAKTELRAQVKDFIKWLKAQGVI